MNKVEREEREYHSLFSDERYAKKAWKEFFGQSLSSSGKALPPSVDPKTGEITFASKLDQEAYFNVKKRLQEEGKDREPMQAELIVECSILRARFDNNLFNTVLERTAGKVKDEITVNKSPYEDLTDEELELLAEHRALQAKNEEEE